MAAPFGAAISQSAPSSPRTLTLRIDNDAFDFWMKPWNRPDEEYTSGVHVTEDGGDAPRWAHALLASMPVCAPRLAECRTGRIEIGQDIYTPSVSVDSAHAAPGSRPNAGWLYLSESARRLRVDRSDELTIALGVTGPPSLARQMQRLAHDVAPAFNRPTDWSSQIGFEPGLLVRYAQERRIGGNGDAPLGFDLLPRVAATIGNVRTDAEIGFRARGGWHLAHPWLPSDGATSVALTIGASARAIARDLFLDGNTFTMSPRVGHEPVVGEGEAGLELRRGRFMVAYRAATDTRAYAAGPRWHPWSSLVGAFTYAR
ncbi:MAG TPA: lipid A deacylase LpxR family protein [Gemmatimonadaceae bacterium]|nr:lipid A deacylase LpxR family protein [Gemmatimonadaceae bacterium]